MSPMPLLSTIFSPGHHLFWSGSAVVQDWYKELIFTPNKRSVLPANGTYRRLRIPHGIANWLIARNHKRLFSQ